MAYATDQALRRMEVEENKEKGGQQLQFPLLLLLYLSPLPFSVLQAQAVEVFPQQRLGTSSVNV